MKIENLYNHIGIGPSLDQNRKAPEKFIDLLRQELAQIDTDQKVAKSRLVDLATGRDPDLVGVSLTLTKAELSFKLLVRVRNKLLEAYQEIMRMQL